MRIAIHDEQDEDMERNKIDDEDITENIFINFLISYFWAIICKKNMHTPTQSHKKLYGIQVGMSIFFLVKMQFLQIITHLI